MKYSDIKKEIYGYYKHIGNIDMDNIIDANDHIIDEHLDSKRFENATEEFYITVSMCSYMIENNLYDEYFFESFEELLDEFNSTSAVINNIEDELKKDIDEISDYIQKDKLNQEYYDNLSGVYNSQIERNNKNNNE